MDSNQSGTISFDEFASWWSRRTVATGGALDEELIGRMQQQWAELDTDGSGDLDGSEFEVLMVSLASSDWAETEDHASGRTYFYNRQSKETRWSEPSSDVAVDGFMRAHGLTEPEAGKPARSMPARPRSSTPPRASPARAARVSMAKREPPSLDAMRGSQSRPKAQRGAAPARPRQKSEAVFLDGVDLSELLDGEPTEELIALHQEEGVAVPPESAAEPYDETLRRSLRQHYRSKPTGLPV